MAKFNSYNPHIADAHVGFSKNMLSVKQLVSRGGKQVEHLTIKTTALILRCGKDRSVSSSGGAIIMTNIRTG